MAAPSKKARTIRKAAEFDMARLAAEIGSPRTSSLVYSWSLEEIRGARSMQMAGNFRLPARMAEGFRTDDALHVARENRLAPLRCLPVEIVPSRVARGAPIANEAEALFGRRGIGVTPETIADIQSALVDHGVAIGANTVTPRSDGSRIDLAMRAWPMEFVRWDPYARAYKTQIEGGPEETIVHGDGRWVVFSKSELEPFKNGALLAACLVWARHALSLRDWSKGSTAHGSAKLIGEMATGVALQEKDGSLTKEAKAFLALLRDMASADTPVGIRPSGSKTEFVANDSTAWNVWKELVDNAEKAAARIYLGTDGVLGAQGGAPGVDIGALFGVATTKVQGDIECIERGILTGVIEPWCALNFGDSTLAPQRKYLVPDGDQDARVKSLADRRAAFWADVDSARKNGCVVDQAYLDALAKQYEIDVPKLPPAETGSKKPSIALAPTDIARVVSVNEARASAGLGELLKPDGQPDPDGRLTVEEYSAKKAALAAAASAPAPASPSP